MKSSVNDLKKQYGLKSKFVFYDEIDISTNTRESEVYDYVNTRKNDKQDSKES